MTRFPGNACRLLHARKPGHPPAICYSLTPMLVNAESTLIDLLLQRALSAPSGAGYTFLADGERPESELTFPELDRRARAVAASMQRLGLQGERALLLYQPGLDFIAGFFGCLYAGVIAVPVYPPKKNQSYRRVEAILHDARARIILTGSATAREVERALRELAPAEQLLFLATDAVDAGLAGDWRRPGVTPGHIAFLQYTSGSTGTPKGVMVTHANLLANLRAMEVSRQHLPGTVLVSWLPVFHDMGLVYGILMPLYGGFPCYLMSPVAFITKPIRWLQALARYRGTHSAAPNFAFDLCLDQVKPEQLAGLDFSSLRNIVNGAEPVKADTVARFTRLLKPYGTTDVLVSPAFGLAEGTLKITAVRTGEMPVFLRVNAAALERGAVEVQQDAAAPARTLVGCGAAETDTRVRIVAPATRIACAPGEIGEIWVSGATVAAGYWQRPAETEYTFRATTVDGDGSFYLRTGDMGFVWNGQLFVTGRIKDLIIVRGVNHYPQDIEHTAENSHPSLRKGGGAAFIVRIDDLERLVVVQEVHRTHIRQLAEADVFAAVRAAVAEQHELEVFAVVLLKPYGLPKTSSGKVQRQECKKRFLDSTLDCLAVNAPWPRSWFPEPPGRLLARRALLQPARAAVACGDVQLTYLQLDAYVNRMVAHLRAEGITPGTGAAVYALPSLELVAAVLALLRMGVTCVPVSPAPAGVCPPAGNALPLLVPSGRLAAHCGRFARVIALDALPPEEPARADAPGDDGGAAPSFGDGAQTAYTLPQLVAYFGRLDDHRGDDERGPLCLWEEKYDLTSLLECVWAVTRGVKLVLPDLSPAAPPPAVPAGGTDFSLLYFSSNEAEFADGKYHTVLAGARFADQHGFKAVWIPERHFHRFGGLFPDPAVLGAALAMITERVRIRAGSVVLPLHDPVLIAESWSMVDNLSQGRIDLAFARGWNPNDFVLSPHTFADSRQTLFSRVAEVRKLWRGEPVTRRNGKGEATSVTIFPLPRQPELQTWITCSGGRERFVEAGENGDNVLTALLFQSFEELAEKIAAYREARGRKGYDPSTGKVTLMLHTFVSDNLDYVRRQVREPFRKYLKSSTDLWQQEMTELTGLGEDAMEQLLDFAFERYFRETTLFGTPDSCLERVQNMAGIGVDEIACLVDFGVDSNTVLSNLPFLAALKARAGESGPAPSVLSSQLARVLLREGASTLHCPAAVAGALDRELVGGGEAAPLRVHVTDEPFGRISGPAGKHPVVTTGVRNTRHAWLAALTQTPPAEAAAPIGEPRETGAGQRAVAPHRPVLAYPRLKQLIVSSLAELIDVQERDIATGKSFYSLGVDSLKAVKLMNRLGQAINLPLSPTLLFEASTVDKLAERLVEEQQSAAAALAPPWPPAAEAVSAGKAHALELAAFKNQVHEPTRLSALTEEELAALLSEELKSSPQPNAPNYNAHEQ